MASFLVPFLSYRRLLFKFWTLRFKPPFGSLETTCDVHLRLIRKRVVNILLMLIELFSPDVTTEALRASIGSKSTTSLQRAPVDPKFQVEGVAPTFLLIRKLG